MALCEFLPIMRSRWYVLVVALLCAVVFTGIQFRNSGVYSTRTVIYLVHHNSDPQGAWPAVGSTDETLVNFAGTIVSEMNKGRPVARYASEDAPFYGVGVRQGIKITQSDSGGQWWSSFGRAEIEVQVVGTSREWVESQQRDVLARIVAMCRSAQGAAWDDPNQRITPFVAPLTDSVEHVAPSRFEQVIAVGAILAAALMAGCWVAVRWERRSSRAAGRLPGGEPAARASAVSATSAGADRRV
ncbi:MAG: hypothetical protein WAX29_09660 [Propionibacterium sp.]